MRCSAEKNKYPSPPGLGLYSVSKAFCVITGGRSSDTGKSALHAGRKTGKWQSRTRTGGKAKSGQAILPDRQIYQAILRDSMYHYKFITLH
jgi:hypothetical protein